MLPGHIEMLPGHTELLPRHTELLPEHTKLFPGHTELLPGHTEMPPGHTELLPGHTELLPGTQNCSPDRQNCSPDSLEHGREKSFFGRYGDRGRCAQGAVLCAWEAVLSARETFCVSGEYAESQLNASRLVFSWFLRVSHSIDF